uniref:Uncharacterized protein n=1 Tax=Globisporangium ultimum (strain ATCC 200006 / CBS 805.95 / DAOM BR144) TaxID=431595 RepID=K3WH53_GLOUD
MDAARSLLRPPAASPSPANDRAPVAEWSSPTFTRARARPSNLHTYLRTSASFPLSQAYHSNSAGNSGHSQPHPHARIAGSSVSSSSSVSGSTKCASGHATPHAINNR